MGKTIIAVANQKGGVAKTTTVLNLGAELTARGRTVIMVDIDPQASLSISLGINAPEASIVEVLGDHRPGVKTIRDVIRPVGNLDRLWLIPSDIALASTSVGMERRPARETLLKQALSQVKGDYVLVDCPPSLGLLTVNALVAADNLAGGGQSLEQQAGRQVGDQPRQRMGAIACLLNLAGGGQSLRQQVGRQVGG
ncbi:MAG TPA: hypothetical protein ENJ31_01215 [Anaerolineae bacterium]|nr:hypothetical protein [Anaerolineae bacterium]